MSFVYFLKATWYNSSLVFTHYGQKIRPREGKYVIFPSHLQHASGVNITNDDRSLVSFNYTLHGTWGGSTSRITI